ncbi:MAG: hypothetical protein IPI55_19540 [Flavobacteriales bacterium]|nr:hypothetical protein [Flavobacteriales bacterium]
MKAFVQRIRRTIGGWPEDLRAFLFLAVCALIAWWPLATFTYCVVHGDMLDCWLPWRTFIADCLQNGEWPVWNPYQQMGYPVHADLQGPAWYPEALLLGGTIGQSIYVLQSLVIVYLLVAGMGMYRLAKQFCGSHSAALAVGVAYMLSGFFTAHVMHQYSFISGAWWPWMFAAFLRLLDKPSWRPALEAAVFQFLLLTGGNHTFTIIGFYLMLALIIMRSIQFLRAGDRRAALRLFGHLLLFACASLVMACGVLHAWWYSAPFIERMGGMEYAMAAQNPFTWKATLSFLIPWATTGGPEITGTNITMANAHMGMLLLLFVPLAFLRKRTATENVLLVFGAVCLLASFGDALPVHRWLYSALPGLDVFRFPSYYTYFTLLCWLLPVARTLAQWNELTPRSRTALWALKAIAAAIILIAVLRAATIQFGLGFALDDVHANLFEWMNATSIAERTIVHGVVQLALLAVFAAMLWKRKLFSTTRLVALVAVEGVIAVLLCSWQTGISDTSPSIIHRIVEMRPKGHVLADARPMGMNKDDRQALKPLWRNTNVFTKYNSHEGFNSYWPKRHLALQQDSVAYYHLLVHPLAFHIGAQTSDPSSVVVVEQWSCGMLIRSNAASACSLIVQQNDLPGWRASIKGKEVEHFAAFGAAIGVALPAGEHLVRIEYSQDHLLPLRCLSLGMFVVIVMMLVLASTSGLNRMGLLGGVLAVLLASAVAAFCRLIPANAQPRLAQEMNPVVNSTMLFSTGMDSLINGGHDWSAGYEINTDELRASQHDALVLEGRYRFAPDTTTEPTVPEAYLVVSVEDAHGNFHFYRTEPLVGSTTETATVLVAQVEQLRWKPGKLKAYVWNNGPGTVLLDDFRVSVMPWDSLGVTY